MNSKRYAEQCYPVRPVTDLKDLVMTSCRMASEKTAYLEKDQPGGAFQAISYGKLRNDMNGLGTALLQRGFADAKIAVIGENSYRWVLTYLTVVCGVGVIVPLDRELPESEIANLLRRSGAQAIVCTKKAERKVRSVQEWQRATGETPACMIRMQGNAEEGILSLDELIEEGKQAIVDGDRTYTQKTIDPDVMCTLLFTSGTTGLAKGVMLSHKNIVANVYNMSQYVHIPPYGVGLSVLPMHHSYEMTCHILTALYQQVCVAICQGLKYIQKDMAEAEATVMLGVPLVFGAMRRRVFKQAEASGRLEKLQRAIRISRKLKLYNHPAITRRMFREVQEAFGGHMELFIAGGAAIDPEIIEDFQAMGLPMIQGYGMTENAPIICLNRDVCSKSNSVGQAMPNTEIRVIEQDGDGIGELVVRSDSVMLGYYDNAEATAETVRDGWLYTGDYGYRDSEGFYYISGRKKNVIVTKGGKNIFPEEVEFYLMESDYISEVLVHGIEDEKSGDILVRAEIFPNYEAVQARFGTVNEEELHRLFKRELDRINDKMPPYKAVKRFGIRTADFEKTTTRKVKRHTAANIAAPQEEEKE